MDCANTVGQSAQVLDILRLFEIIGLYRGLSLQYPRVCPTARKVPMKISSSERALFIALPKLPMAR